MSCAQTQIITLTAVEPNVSKDVPRPCQPLRASRRSAGHEPCEAGLMAFTPGCGCGLGSGRRQVGTAEGQVAKLVQRGSGLSGSVLNKGFNQSLWVLHRDLSIKPY